ncbi:RNA polymerase sigma factor [Ornithinimicrobium tianjinense]|uniref:DNA-directed RNA polymerase specialized sigma subunit, sigma24 family n=1 Tax=Ornithinimicrobium tianjinense TaxID=1195761 RepID=A0A917BI01_9MICO|nr:hypothetical protein [Ornithinimicrobium tianjinense]GGF42242.1 hypothetical protein GCM10011366_07540 [Ornithinimicrobium tianjinense]
MAGRPGPEFDREGLVRAHAPTLHRVALMLAGHADGAEDLVAQAVRSSGEGSPSTLDELLTRIVREHRRRSRRAGRDRLRLRAPSGGDAGDVLDSLDATARAAVVLHFGAGWPTERAARAAGIRPARLAHLLRTADLDRAVAALADSEDRSEPELVRQLLDRLPPSSPAGPPESAAEVGSAQHVAGGGQDPTETAYRRKSRTNRRRAVAATTAALVVGGTVVALGGGETRPEPPPPDGPSLAERGWVLGPDGEPPRGVDGMRLLGTATVDQGDRYAPLRVPFSQDGGSAVWAVLWCDLIAPEDPNVALPSVTLDTQGAEVSLRCAGNDGLPAVDRLVPLPASGSTLTPTAWTGDLPAEGQATLAFYAEHDTVTHVEGTGAVPAPGPSEVTVTQVDERWWIWNGDVRTDLVEVGHDSDLTVWAGTSLVLGVLVDGVRLTDDGDPKPWDPPASGNWKEQDPELRQGFWTVATGDRSRTFALPAEVRPAVGQRRTVAVTTVTGGGSDPRARWQVRVSRASRVPAEAASVPLRPGRGWIDPDLVPDEIGGYRLAGRWLVPADGMARTVDLAAQDLAKLRPVMLADDPIDDWGDDPASMPVLASSAGLTMMGPYAISVAEAWWSEAVAWSDGRPPPDLEDGVVKALLPAEPGHPTRTVLAYLPVSYDDFDFDAAPLTASSWPAGTASPYGTPSEGGPQRVAELVGDADDRLSFQVPHGGGMLEVTTQGRGRMRVLVDGRPWTDPAPAHDGWWSSWTSRHVTSVVWNLPPGATAVLEVEGWEEGFSVDLLAW